MKIWKYDLDADRSDEWVTVEMPGLAEAGFLSVGIQRGVPVLWAQINQSAPLVKRRYWAATTGSPIPIPLDARFLGTIQMFDDTFVLHVFAEDPL